MYLSLVVSLFFISLILQYFFFAKLSEQIQQKSDTSIVRIKNERKEEKFYFKKQDLQKFISWLRQNGCKIKATLKENEYIRFEGKQVGVLNADHKDNNSYTQNAIQCFYSGKDWNQLESIKGSRKIFYGVKRKTKVNKKQVRFDLLARDGDKCFYCGESLGVDVTIEHLDPLSRKGKDTLSHMVLSHSKCNQEAGNLSVSEKVKMALSKRLKLNNCVVQKQY